MNDDQSTRNKSISRRKFIGISGAAVAIGAIPLESMARNVSPANDKKKIPKIAQYRTLGRTGFEASDISMGGTRVKDSSVYAYALDCGINYFDTAESYSGGQSEKLLGEALKSVDRKKIFITSKVHVDDKDSETTVLDRFAKCQERLGTDYIDAFYLHGVSDLDVIGHAGFHSAMDKLKADGRLRFVGLSSHGSRWGRGNASMEDVLCAAAEDGRFDLMLLIYNFMNKEAGEKVLAACKASNVGTTAMKTSPGVLRVEPFDPDNPTPDQARMIERMRQRGMDEERIVERIQSSLERAEESMVKTQPFAEKYKIKTEEQLRLASIQWVLQNPDMHTVCVSFSDFALVDSVVPLSGTKLSSTGTRFLEDFRHTFNDQYCRHGCDSCVSACPEKLPVSTIMKYAYYFECQQREKYAIGKYSDLDGHDASNCLTCNGSCRSRCPHGVDVRGQLVRAHSLLTIG